MVLLLLLSLLLLRTKLLRIGHRGQHIRAAASDHALTAGGKQALVLLRVLSAALPRFLFAALLVLCLLSKLFVVFFLLSGFCLALRV